MPTVTEKLDAVRQTTARGVEYWHAREIMGVLGYESWRNFDGVIKRAMNTFDALGEATSHHFVETVKMAGNDGGPEGKDYFLSRAACYVIAMNGNPQKAEIAEAQRYFAIQTRHMERIQQWLADERRLEIRKRVSDNNTRLGKAAKAAGVSRYNLFHGAGIVAMYSMRLADIKVKRGIGENENWLDRMDTEELAANDFRITQAEAKLRRENIQGERAAIEAHRQVGKGVRDLISELGNTMPEDLPVAVPINEVKKRLTVRKKKKAVK